jgi:hypothetical protein
MSLSPEFLQQVQAAQDEARALVNAGGEVFYNCASNWETVRRVVTKNVEQRYWTNPSIWVSGIMGARADGSLQNRPTREERERERERNDRRDGRQTKITDKDGHAKPTVNGPFKGTRDFLQNLMNPTDALAAKASKTPFPPYDKDVQDMSPEHRKMFQSLSGADMRAWMKHRAVVKHRQTYNLDAPKES